jgi:uncharacterized protein (DUF1697 family)
MKTSSPENKRRYIAFLRAINVGGRTVKMDHLRRLFAEMGFANVETFIASGNVIFDSAQTDAAALERAIEAGLQSGLGYRVDTFIRTPAELAAVAATWPFGDADREMDHSFYVAFLGAPPDASSQERLLAHTTEVDAFHVDGREVYWLRRDALGESSFAGGLLEKALGMPATVRNGRTVTKIVIKYAAL